MKLSESTVEVLKNFASINTGILLAKGKKQRTISSSKTVFAEAFFEDELPETFGIYDLNNFLSILTLDDKPAAALSVENKNIIITHRDGRSTTKYRCCAPEMIITPPTKELDMGVCDVEFSLSEADLNWVSRVASTMASENISIEATNGILYVCACDASNDAANKQSSKIGPFEGQDFTMLFRAENWKMMPGNYQVSLSTKGIARFTNTQRPLVYWVALEAAGKTKK